MRFEQEQTERTEKIGKGRKSDFGRVGESELEKKCPLSGLLRRPDAAARRPYLDIAQKPICAHWESARNGGAT